MLVSYRWLCSFANLEIGLEEALKCLTSCGLEIEGVNDLGILSGNIICGRILEKTNHPDSEHLTLCKVDVGKENPLRIVCGASNHKAGDMVPVAVDGAVLPGNFKIKKSKIRGEVSEGMMCSARELGLGDDHAGLMILPEDWIYKVGMPFDAIIDIKITPNRSDALSIFGIARDLLASNGRSGATIPAVKTPFSQTLSKDFVTLVNEAPQGCPIYKGRLLRGVKIAPSPAWLRCAVECSGLRSINNVVDVTNYIMIELGHPIHSFDANKLNGKKVCVRYAKEDEAITTLDNCDYKLKTTDLVIADDATPIALAGIMGGLNSEVTDESTDIFIECAYFDPATVRATSKRLLKPTDASYRFERGTDWGSLDQIVDRAAELMQQVAGGEVCQDRLSAGPGMTTAKPIEFSTDRVKSLLGLEISGDVILKTLTSLGFTMTPNGTNKWLVSIPSYRNDIAGSADLVEEVARITGYDNLPTTLPIISSAASKQTTRYKVKNRLFDAFTQLGLNEAKNYSFLDMSTVQKCGFDVKLNLANPLTMDYAAMRPSLIPGLIKSLIYNLNRNIEDINLFEIGGVWDGSSQEVPPAERWQWGCILNGTLFPESWQNHSSKKSDFFTGKFIAESILKAAGVKESDYVVEALPDEGKCKILSTLFHPGRSARFLADGKSLAYVGELHPMLVKEFDLRQAPIIIYGWLDRLDSFISNHPSSQPISQFPSIARDLALVADINVTNESIVEVIAKRAKSLLKSVSLFDYYVGEHIEPGKKSLAYTLTFSAKDRTLKDEEINEMIQKILSELNVKFGIVLRS